MIYGQRVRQLRAMYGMTQAELARRILTSQDRLSRLEKDQASCDPETEQMLAVELGVTDDYLHRPPVGSLQAHSPQFRARSRVTQRDRAAGMEWARLLDEEYTRLAGAGTLIPLRPMHTSDRDPASAAQDMRDLLGFTQEEPLPYLVLAMERLGIRVLGLPFAVPSMDAFSAWRDGTPVIALMTGVPADRLRFTLAHELGHLVLHQAGQTGQQVETEADEFAAKLLTPSGALASALPQTPTLNSLTMVKTQWGVSIKMLVRRARDLGVIDADRAQSLYKQISKRGWNHTEPGFVPNEKPRGFRKLTEISYGTGPNVEALASDAGWSHELTLQVLGEHAAADELPRKPRQNRPRPETAQSSNVIAFERRTPAPSFSHR